MSSTPESVLYEKAQQFRALSQHQIGSNMERDLDYISRQRDLHQCSTFQKQDNLLLPSPSKLLHETSFSISVGSVRDIHTAPSQQHVDPSTHIQVSARQLGVSAQGIERNLPAPPDSPFQYNDHVLEPEYVGLLLRSYLLDRLDDQELRFLSDFLFSLPDAELVEVYQAKSFEIFSSFILCKGVPPRGPAFQHRERLFESMTVRPDLRLRQLPDLDLSRLGSYVITFNSTKQSPLVLGQEYVQDVPVRLRSKTASAVTIHHFSSKKDVVGVSGEQTKDYDLTFQPSESFEMRRGSSTTVRITFTAHRPIRLLDELIVLSLTGGRRVYLCLHVYVESKVFGIAPELLELVDVVGIGPIPRVLEYMKSELIRKGALHSVGIFRKAGHERRMGEIKTQFDLENYVPCQNVNDFATLIKVWFRSLPQKVFSYYPTEYFQSLDAHSTSACLETLNGLPEMSRVLLNWLLSFMVDVVEECEINKMTASNLAIVFSPNLYKVGSNNPGVLMMMTSKMSQFFQTLVELREAQEYEDEDEDEYEDEEEEEGEYYDD